SPAKDGHSSLHGGPGMQFISPMSWRGVVSGCCIAGLAAVFLFGGGFRGAAQDKGAGTAPSDGRPLLPEPALPPVAPIPSPAPVAVPAAPPQSPPPPLPANGGSPKEPSVEQLIARLTDLRAHRVQLDRQEKELIATIRQKVRQQRLALADL